MKPYLVLALLTITLPAYAAGHMCEGTYARKADAKPTDTKDYCPQNIMVKMVEAGDGQALMRWDLDKTPNPTPAAIKSADEFKSEFTIGEKILASSYNGGSYSGQIIPKGGTASTSSGIRFLPNFKKTTVTTTCMPNTMAISVEVNDETYTCMYTRKAAEEKPATPAAAPAPTAVAPAKK